MILTICVCLWHEKHPSFRLMVGVVCVPFWYFHGQSHDFGLIVIATAFCCYKFLRRISPDHSLTTNVVERIAHPTMIMRGHWSSAVRFPFLLRIASGLVDKCGDMPSYLFTCQKVPRYVNCFQCSYSTAPCFAHMGT